MQVVPPPAPLCLVGSPPVRAQAASTESPDEFRSSSCEMQSRDHDEMQVCSEAEHVRPFKYSTARTRDG